MTTRPKRDKTYLVPSSGTIKLEHGIYGIKDFELKKSSGDDTLGFEFDSDGPLIHHADEENSDGIAILPLTWEDAERLVEVPFRP